MGSRSDIDHWRINATVYEDRVEEDHYITDPAKNIRRRPQKIIWQMGEQLGFGGFGEVRLQKSEGKVRAVKQIVPSAYLSIDGWEKELKALLEFSKPKFKETGAFVELYGWFQSSYGLFLAMEYIQLGDLERNVIAHSGKIPEAEARDIVTQILTGLEIMHAESFVHRDLKPKNILVVTGPPEWWVKIADFGLSKRLTETTTYNTRNGTTHYMAPELLDYYGSSSKYTYAIDLWAVGCIAYWLLTGKIPFPRNELQKYCRHKSLFPSQILLDNSVERSGCEFIQGLLVKHPEQRPSATQALNDAWITSGSKNWKALEDPSQSKQEISEIAEVTASTENYNTASHLGLKFFEQSSFPNTRFSTKSSPQDFPVLETRISNNSYQSQIIDGNHIRAQESLSSQKVVMDLLLGGANNEIYNKNILASLFPAAANGHVEVVQILLDNGADVNVLNENGWTPLHAAACNNHFDVVQILLDNDADFNVSDEEGYTPLNFAASKGHVNVVGILLDKGADFNMADKNGYTPLHIAASKGHVNVVGILLDNGADVNVLCKSGWTPLHAAAALKDHFDVIQILLDRGANLYVADKDGHTPLQVAATKGHAKSVRILLNTGKDFNVVE